MLLADDAIQNLFSYFNIEYLMKWAKHFDVDRSKLKCLKQCNERAKQYEFKQS